MTLSDLYSSKTPILKSGLEGLLEVKIELHQAYYGVEFFGQDNKAKVPVNEKGAVVTNVKADTSLVDHGS